MSPMSAPAQKALPVPVRTTQRTPASASADTSSTRSSSSSAGLSALSLCGRLRVSSSTPSAGAPLSTSAAGAALPCVDEVVMVRPVAWVPAARRSSDRLFALRVEEVQALALRREPDRIAHRQRRLRIDARHRQRAVAGARLENDLRAELLDDGAADRVLVVRRAEREVLRPHAEDHLAVAPGGQDRSARGRDAGAQR